MTGIGGAPFVAGEKAGGDEIDVRLERRFEAVFPALELGEDRDVIGDERVFARAETIAVLAEIDELRGLAFADDELRAVLDRLVVVRETATTRCRASRR